MKQAIVEYEEIDPKYLMLHIELASGTYGSKKYSFIQNVGGESFVLIYNKKKYQIRTFNLIRGLLETIEGEL